MKRLIFGLAASLFVIVASFAFTKPVKEAKKQTRYYFEVTSTTTWGSESTASLATVLPSTSQSGFSCTTSMVHVCILGFSGYYQDPITLQYSPASSTGQTTNPALVVGPGAFLVRVGKP